MEPGETCNLRTQVFPGVPRHVLFISFIISSPPLPLVFWKSHFTAAETPAFILLVSNFLVHFPALSLYIQGDFVNYVLQIANFVIGYVLFLSPLMENFKCNPISHFQTWFVLLWLLHFHNNNSHGCNRLLNPPKIQSRMKILPLHRFEYSAYFKVIGLSILNLPFCDVRLLQGSWDPLKVVLNLQIKDQDKDCQKYWFLFLP